MKAYITICCKEKSTKAGKTPAIERYISKRIKNIYAKSSIDKINFFILSGKYGLLSPTDRIEWYDKLLDACDVSEMSEIVSKQISNKGITEIVLYANSDWKNYINVITNSCKSVTIVEVEKY